MRSASVLLLALAATGSGIAGCSYDPQFADGTLMCSAKQECPEGYACRANACFSTKDGMGGMNGGMVPPAVINRYLGTWTLAPTSTVVTSCDDGFMDTFLVSPVNMATAIVITPGTAGQSDLESDWLCPFSLRVSNNGAHLSDPTPTCSEAGAAPLQMQTWTVTRFDITANTGATAMHNGAYRRVDLYNNGAVVNCTQTVTAPLTKN